MLDLSTYIPGDYFISDVVSFIFYFIRKYIMACATASDFIIDQSGRFKMFISLLC